MSKEYKMKGDVLNALRLGMVVLVWYGVFVSTLTNGTHEVNANEKIEQQQEQKDVVNVIKDDDDGDGYAIFNGDPFLRDPWKEWREERDRKDREQQEREERRVCGRDAGFSLVDEKCNAVLLFDLPANKTISLAKHLRSHTRLKRRVLTLERMMRVAMAYIKLGAAVRADKAGRK